MKESSKIDGIRSLSGYLFYMMVGERSLHALFCNNGFGFSSIENMFSNSLSRENSVI